MVAPGLAASNLVLAFMNPAVSPVLPPQNAKLMFPVTFGALEAVLEDVALPEVETTADDVAEPPPPAAELVALDALEELAELEELVDELLDSEEFELE